MHVPIAFITNHRLARLFTLAWLWLAWAAGFVREQTGGALDPSMRARLVRMRRFAACLIFLHAASRALPSPRTPYYGPPWPQRSGALRALIGAALRHELRGRGGLASIGALMRVLAAPARAIAKLATRLRFGFTRRRRAFMPAPRFIALALHAYEPTPAAADSS
jgi:hypothetical protein